MRTPLLLIAVALLAACSEDVTPTPAAVPPPAAQQPAPNEQGDVAAAEMAEPAKATPDNAATDAAPDPCDLSGYDMSQMTVDQHEELVKACQNSKQ